ncbi:MAG: Rieske (2Fe-2S) protein [Bdellovibrionota bacterium]
MKRFDSIPSLLCRRSFLKQIHAFLMLAAAVGCNRKSAVSVQPPLNLGPLSGFGFGRTSVSLYRLIIVRDGDSVRALSGVCTHQPCLLNLHDDGLDCPCHGSRFDLSGAKLAGPAPKSLPWYRVGLSERQELLVYRTEEVPSDWRLAIPGGDKG